MEVWRHRGLRRVGGQEGLESQRGYIGSQKVGEAVREWEASRGWEVEEDQEAKKKQEGDRGVF